MDFATLKTVFPDLREKISRSMHLPLTHHASFSVALGLALPVEATFLEANPAGRRPWLEPGHSGNALAFDGASFAEILATLLRFFSEPLSAGEIRAIAKR